MLKRAGRIIVLGVSLLQAAALNQPAPAFSLLNSHRQRRTLADYKGKIVFVDFWASWCGPCQQELPALNHLAADYQGKKIKVIAINVDEDPDDGRRSLVKLGLASPSLEILWDSKKKAVSAYDIEGMPSSFILDSHGIIRFTHLGFHSRDPEAWRREIDSLSAKNAS